MELLNGSLIANTIKSELKARVNERKAADLKVPHLAAIIVGNDGASKTYVQSKVKSCLELGYDSTLIELSENTTQEELLEKIKSLNNDVEIDGYIVQLPLPKHIDETAVLLAVDPKKDVDGFHPENVGRMALGLPAYLPATPAGIVELLSRFNIETAGKKCVILGRSHIVGMPMSLLMQRNHPFGNCTVTVLHSRSKNIIEECQQADILIAAIGKPYFVTAEMVKEGAVVIDVGITRVPDASKKSGFKLAGDVDFDGVSKKVSFITPVPGGVGPMTIVSLLLNTMQAVEQKNIK
jgi:methylenetetrahydrofolate dehydrogenase (NADP+)/methenyltetrahydrofolate cyclohydrolase